MGYDLSAIARTDQRPTTNDQRQRSPVLGSQFSVLGSEEHSPFVLCPSSAAEAAEAIREHTSAGRSVRIRGGGTKSHGLPAADVLLSTAGLRGIRAYARDDLYVTVGAGTSLAELQAELARGGMWAPLVAPWPESTVGGIVATNWNAPLRMRYGGLRDLVLAATIALGDGRAIRAGRPVVKNVAGYDLPKVFVGAHGTLGLIADVTLKLAPLPRVRASLIAPLDDLERGLACGARLLRVCLNASALLLVRPPTTPSTRLRAGDHRPTTFEDRISKIEDSNSSALTLLSSILDPRSSNTPSVVGDRSLALIYTAEGLPEDVAAELAEARKVLESEGIAEIVQVDEPSGSQIWARWLGGTPAESGQAVVRAGVATKDLPALLRSLPSDPAGSFVADLASGLLYARGAGDVAALRRAALAMGGYSIGLPMPGCAAGSQDVWGYTPESLDLMRALRHRWGAGGLLNPGAFLV